MSSSIGADGPGTEQREMMEFLSQETRHSVIMVVLGHPDHLPSHTEIQTMVPKSTGAVTDAIEALKDRGLLSVYAAEDPDNPNERDYPEVFIGPTERGIRIFHEYNLLRLVPAQRALYDNTRKTETMERHLAAERPPLPEQIEQALAFEEPEEAEADPDRDAEELFEKETAGGSAESAEALAAQIEALTAQVERALQSRTQGAITAVEGSPEEPQSSTGRNHMVIFGRDRGYPLTDGWVEYDEPPIVWVDEAAERET